jgi:1,4-dihydroxy-2-naphthoyl-CoA hydrolase
MVGRLEVESREPDLSRPPDTAYDARHGGAMDRDEFIRHHQTLLPHTVSAALGIRVLSYDPDALQVGLDIDDRHRQPMGWLHGGVSALLAESAASVAAAMSIDVERFEAFGVDLNATHLRAKRSGSLVATARPLRRGRTTHVYRVDVTDERNHLICAARCTLAIRSLRTT